MPGKKDIPKQPENFAEKAEYDGVHDVYSGVHETYQGVHGTYQGVHRQYPGVGINNETPGKHEEESV